MFYSHTFLARKGPLGIVWCAAHLQNRLRKPHYIATDILAVVDRILFPEVPIALRLSGHLLLGVVRIYSKKVDYLCRDCEVVLFGVRNNFSSLKTDLPKVSRCPKFQDVTVPISLELENLDFDNELRNEGDIDVHMRREEEITLVEQVPVETDPFATGLFSEDISISDQIQISRIALAEEINSTVLGAGCPRSASTKKVISPISVDRNSSVQVEEPTFPIKSPQEIYEIDTNNDLHIGDNFADIECQRDASHDDMITNFSALLVGGDVIMKPAGSVEQLNSKKDTHSPTTNNVKMLTEQAQSSHEPQNQSSVEKSTPLSYDLRIRPCHLRVSQTPELRIRVSPLRGGLRNRRRGKRKFDVKTVFTNGYIKSLVDDPSDIIRVKKMRPSSALDTWKFNHFLRKEGVFKEILTTGACIDLQNLFKKEFILSKISSAVLAEDFCEKSALASATVSVDQCFGFEDNFSEQNPHQTLSEPVSEVAPYTENGFGVPESSSYIPDNLESEAVNRMGMTIPIEILPPSYHEPSVRSSEFETSIPSSFVEEHLSADNFEFSDKLNLDSSAEFATDDLDFLKADNDTITGCHVTKEIHFLSARTRAAAQYLRGLSPVTQTPDKQVSVHNLTEILEGKTRKLCARMFFEALILKSFKLVVIQQREAYGDVILKLSALLLSGQF